MSRIWVDYSPEFEDAYERFTGGIDVTEHTFNDLVYKFDQWINEGRVRNGLDLIQPTLKQVYNLAVNAHDDGIRETTLRIEVADRRYRLGYGYGYKDIITGKVVRREYDEKRRRK